MNHTPTLTVRFQNKVQKFPWRQKYSPSEFLSLLANSFKIPQSSRILALKDNYGFFFPNNLPYS